MAASALAAASNRPVLINENLAVWPGAEYNATMAAQVIAAYIAAAASSVTLLGNIIFNGLTWRADIGVRRREAAEAQRRSVYTSFAEVVEPVADQLQRIIRIGSTKLEWQTTEQRDVLLAQSIAARSKRVMVELVGPSEVGAAANSYERAVDRTVRACIADDAATAKDEFIEMSGARENFVKAARSALDPLNAG